MDTAPVSFSLLNFRPVESRVIYAMGDVELDICGVAITLHGVTCRNLANGGTSVHLPQSRNDRGEWISAVSLPSELREALADRILEHLLEIGIAKQKYQPAVA